MTFSSNLNKFLISQKNPTKNQTQTNNNKKGIFFLFPHEDLRS